MLLGDYSYISCLLSLRNIIDLIEAWDFESSSYRIFFSSSSASFAFFFYWF